MRKSEVLVLAILVLSIAAAVYFYPRMPERMASHWDARGDVNGYMSRFWGLFLMPAISVLMFLLFLVVPRIDPLKENIEEFRKYFDGFIVLIFLFLVYIYVLTILWNMGKRFSMVLAMPPALGILFFYCGMLIEHAKRNWFIGIRTPWTLSNEKVWDKTHKIGGKLFKVSGVIAFVGILFRDLAFYFVIVPICCVAAYTIVYSYVEYQKEMKLT
ncbi:MAG: SdpI family protein [Candidatus Eisenbacteria bacterium]|nr:SdpI family protein [Candidatus Eisenbacteria bacterium]